MRAFLSTEERREDSVNTRGAAVVVFTGVVASLTASLGPATIRLDLPGTWDAISAVLFFSALGLLVATEVVTLLGVLLPRASASISLDEIQNYTHAHTVNQEKVRVQGTLLAGLIKLLVIDRERISVKTRWLKAAYALLVLGLISVAALGAILGFYEASVL